MIVDLTALAEASGVETTYYAGTVTVGDKTRVMDGTTDRGDNWTDFVLEELLGMELQETSTELQTEAAHGHDLADKVIEVIWAQIDEEMTPGQKYDAKIVDGALVVTEIREETQPLVTSKGTRPVEYLLAYDDHRWDTQIIQVPASLGIHREALVNWAEVNLMGQAQYRNVVMFGLYSLPGEA